MRSFKKTTRRAIALLLVLVTIASVFAGCATHNTIVTGKMERSGNNASASDTIIIPIDEEVSEEPQPSEEQPNAPPEEETVKEEPKEDKDISETDKEDEEEPAEEPAVEPSEEQEEESNSDIPPAQEDTEPLVSESDEPDVSDTDVVAGETNPEEVFIEPTPEAMASNTDIVDVDSLVNAMYDKTAAMSDRMLAYLEIYGEYGYGDKTVTELMKLYRSFSKDDPEYWAIMEHPLMIDKMSTAFKATTYTGTFRTYNGQVYKSVTGTATRPAGAPSSTPLSATIKAPAGPTRSGYTFTGWQSGSTTYKAGASITLTANKSFTATYKANTYTVKLAFNANGGSGAPATQSTTVTAGNSTSLKIPSTKPTRSGYKFVGWGTSSGATSAPYSPGSSVLYSNVTGNKTVTLYAVWQNNPTITIINGSSKKTVTVTSGSNYTIPNVAKQAYKKFSGWALGSGTQVEYKNGETISNIRSDMTITAIWDSGTLSSSSPTITLYTHNNTASVKNGTASSQRLESVTNGHENWYGYVEMTFPSGLYYYDVNGTKHTATNYYVTISHSGYSGDANVSTGLGAVTPQRVEAGKKLTTNTFQSAEGTGYTNGQYTLYVGFHAYDSSDSTESRSNTYGPNLVYYVKNTRGGPDQPSYTVKYMANGGEGAPASQTKRYDLDLALSSTTPTRTGYNFVKWTTGSSGSGTSYNPGGTYTKNANLTLYAQWEPIKHTLTYNANGGTGAPAADTQNYGTKKAISTTKPTRDGATFLGWATTADAIAPNSTYAPGASYTFTQDRTIYAVWKLIDYKINYVLNDDADYPAKNPKTNPTGYNVSTPTITITAPTRPGYAFQGWYSDEGLTTASNTVPQGSTGDKTFYAKWAPINYKLIYDANGGENPPATQSGMYKTTTTVSSGEPTRKGYEFLGWGETAAATSPAAAFAAGATYTYPQADKTIYAIWKIIPYKIGYHLNDDDGIVKAVNPESNPTSYDVTTPTITISDPTRTGYTFKGWYSDEDLSTASKTVPQGSTGDKDFYASWEKNTYKLIYDANGGENAPEMQEDYYLETIAMREGVPTRDHYKFVGWSATQKDPDCGDNPDYRPGDNYTFPAHDQTVYAMWNIEKYNLIFDGNAPDATGVPAKETGGWNTTHNITKQYPSRDDYGFLGWAESPELAEAKTVYMKPGAAYTYPDHDKTVYAIWVNAAYKVTYDANGGDQSTAPSSQGKCFQIDLELSDIIPKRAGYKFLGWNTEPDGDGTDYAPGATYTKDEDMTLYAQWEPVPHNLDYRVGVQQLDGTYEYTPYDNSIHYYGDDLTILPDPADKTGFTFKGWSELPDTMPDKDVLVTGLFQRNKYKVITDENGGSTVEDPVFYYDEEIVLPDKPTKTGYIPSEWKPVDVIEIPEKMPAQDITVTVDWTPIKYQVAYHKNAEDAVGTMENSNHEFDVAKNLSENLFTRKGYKWLGWSKFETSKVAYGDKESVINLTTINDDVVDIYSQWEIIKYPITYVLHDDAKHPATNDEDNPSEYTVLDDIKIKDPERKGYTFEGWYSDVSYTDACSEIPVGSTGPKTFHAKWSPIKYPIYYIMNDTEAFPAVNSPDNPDTYTIEDAVKFEPATRDYYEFKGWYDDPELTVPAKDIEEGSTGERILYAKWSPIKYKITYVMHDSEAAPAVNDKDNPSEYTVEDFIEFKNPTRPGYQFDGWYTDDTFVTEFNQIPIGSHGDKVVHALWELEKYPISYVLNDSTEFPATNNSNPDEYTVEDEVVFKEPIRDYYKFDGWFSDSDLKEPRDKIKKGSTGPVTVYAMWEEEPYDIVYVLNDDSSFPASNSDLNPDTYTYFSPAITFEEPTRHGHKFTGWYKDMELTEPITGIPAKSSGNVTIYADWEIANYPITYILNDNAKHPATNDSTNPATYTIYDVVNYKPATRTGFEFAGWFSDTDLTLRTEGFGQGNTGAKTVYADWELINYRINYHLNDDDVAPASNSDANPETYTIDDTVTYAPPERPGYTFKGWYSDEELTTLTTGIPEGSTGDKDVYAKWEIIIYNIDYVLCDDDESPASNSDLNPHVYTVQTPDIIFEEPTRIDYDFIRWVDCDGAQVTDIPQGSTGDRVLYADWGLHDYTITYVLNGTDKYPAKNNQKNVPFYNYGDEINFYNPTRKGYDFVAWHELEDLSDEPITGYPAKTRGDKIIYAEWTPHVYKITYHYDHGYKVDNPKTYTVEDNFDLRSPFKPGGYVCIGWYDENGRRVRHLAGKYARDLTLTARYMLKEDYEKMFGERITATGIADNSTATLAMLLSIILTVLAAIGTAVTVIAVKKRKTRCIANE